jgi:hypothetical protein
MDGEFIATSQQSKQESGGILEYRFALRERAANHPAIFLIKHYSARPELRQGHRTLSGKAGKDYNIAG